MAFGFYSVLTVASGKVPSAQANYPFLISETDDRFKVVGSGGHVQSSSGYDLIPYIGASGALTTRRHFERERYNSATGEIILWALDASIADGNTTDLAYGDASITTDQQDASAVWSADGNFLRVWHLNQASGSGALDSVGGTTAAKDGSPTQAAAEIGDGQYLDGSSADFVETAAINPSEGTWSAWLKTDGQPTNNGNWFGRQQNDGQRCRILNDRTIQFLDRGGTNIVTSSGTVSDSTWTLVTATAGAAGISLYKNSGAADPSNGGSAYGHAGSAYFYLGQNGQSAEFFKGWVDEFRVSSVRRAADWITTDYNSQSSPSTFLTLGTEQTVGGNSAPTPSAGSLTLAGRAASLAIGVAISLGGLAFSGLPPTVTAELSRAPAQAVLTIAGQAPALALTYATPQGVLTIQGYAPTVTIGTPDVTATPSAGTLALTGLAPSLGLGVSPGAGALTLAGQTPSIGGDLTFTPTQATLALTGQAPSLALTHAVPVGSVTVSGLAPALDFGVSPSAGVIAMTGAAPSLGLGVASPAGSVALAGRAPTVTIDVGSPSLTPATGQLTLTGLAPTASVSSAASFMTATFASRTPSATFTSRTASATFTSRTPSATFTLLE